MPKIQILVPAAICIATGSSAALGASRHDTGQFERLATFVVCENTSCDRSQVELTSSEIVAASENGKLLVYTDSPNRSLGFIGIHDPSAPQALGALTLDGEPTSVAVVDKWALVAVNTTEDLTAPSGYLAVFRLEACGANPAGCVPSATLPLAGQPDSIAISPDHRYAAITIENQRDEDVEVDGVEGGLPQNPPGLLQIVDLVGQPANWSLRSVDLVGLTEYAPGDPEPEFVSVSPRNIAAVTLQENNHIVLVDLRTGKVAEHFPAGTVDLARVDTDNEGVLDPVYSLDILAREPDAVAWLDEKRFVTANEGDLFGGSRGVTVYDSKGKVLLDSGTEIEYRALEHGHYPEDRADNKGTEPEGVAVGRYGDRKLAFVGSERANFVAVYDVENPRKPKFLQLLPSGIGPEGLLPIPQRGLFVIASEDDADLRSTVSIYGLRKGKASYPQVVSGTRTSGPLAGKAPIGWVALSALAANRWDENVMYTAHDSYLKQSRIYVMDVGGKPARIEREIVLRKGGATVDYDVEGLVQRSNGGFWVVSEGAGAAGSPDATPNLLVEVKADGSVLREIALPPSVAALQRSNGYEGVAVTGSGASEQVYVAFQREWTTDPAGYARIGRYTPSTDAWRFFYYPLDAVESPAGGWVGLSEIVALAHGRLLVLERDNQGGPDARVKRLYEVVIAGVTPKAQGETIPLLTKRLVEDIVPDLKATRGWLQEKVEGVAVTRRGDVFIVTDNDGVDGNTGETVFRETGAKLKAAF